MPERRQVRVASLKVCENGHVVDATPTHEWAWQIRHRCGDWTWEDGRYCGKCGERLMEADRA